jgi:hypothetical protein
MAQGRSRLFSDEYFTLDTYSFTLVNDVTHFCEYEICKAYIPGGYIRYIRVIRISKYTFTSNAATNELPA